MNNAKRLVGTLVLLALFGGALFFALRSNEQTQQIAQEQKAIASAEPLRGLIAVDVEAFFKDDRVTQVLVQSKLPVHVARVGSRDMAAKIGTADQPDFFIASGVVAANMIADAARKAGKTATQTSPFHTPLVVASWEPVAKILAANGMARPMAPKVFALDMEKLTQAMLAKQRWRDLKASGDYAVSRSVLVSTTDIRRSNSAAMYLALTSAALNGDVVADRSAAQKYAGQLAELFKRQGFQENYVNGAFDDYLAIGMGKTPLTFIYEAQMVAQALKNATGCHKINTGALGNIVDRVRYGYVVDFADLHFGEWRPFLIFNVADAAITIGVLLLLVRALLTREKKAPRKEVCSPASARCRRSWGRRTGPTCWPATSAPPTS